MTPPGTPVHAVRPRGRTPLDVVILEGEPAVCLEALLYKNDARHGMVTDARRHAHGLQAIRTRLVFAS